MNKFTKTILITAPYLPPKGGGLERYANEVAVRLHREHGWKVIIITSGQHHGKDAKEITDDMTIYRLAYDMKFSNTPFSLGWFFKIRNILKIERPEIINIHNPVPGIGDMTSLLAAGTPTIVTYHANTMVKGGYIYDPFVWIYEKFFLPTLLSRAQYIISSSKNARHIFLRKYLYKSTTITPAVIPEIFAPSPKMKTTDPTILFVAGLNAAEKYKGLGTLIKSIEILKQTIPEIHLVVVGEGNMRKEYEKNVKEKGLKDNITFKGKLTGDALVEEYQKAHIFALPTSNDTHPIVILEAMSCSLPVISTNVGDIATMIDSDVKCGLIINPDNPKELADKIKYLVKNPEFASTLSANGRRLIIERFSWQKRVNEYNDILLRALNQDEAQEKRITFVTPYFFPKIGGLENYAYNIAKRLNASGRFKVSVITSNHQSKEYVQDEIDGMRIHRLPIWFKLSNTPINPFWYWWCRRIFNAEKPDIINAHTPVPYISDIAERTRNGIPFVLTYHNDLVKRKVVLKMLAKIFYALFINGTLDRSDAIITSSQYYVDNSKYLSKLEKHIDVVAPGVDLAQFNSEIDKIWLKQSYDDVFTVLFVGQLSKTHDHKGLSLLIKAAAKLKSEGYKLQLIVVGGGNGIDGYRSIAHQFEFEEIAFTGYVSDSDLPKYYAGSNVLVLPSITAAEGFGMVLIEAGACGTPVIGTDIGGISQALQNNKTGILVEANNIDAIAEAIAKLYNDPALAKEMGDNGCQRAKREFNWDTLADKTEEIFQRIIQEQNHDKI